MLAGADLISKIFKSFIKGANLNAKQIDLDYNKKKSLLGLNLIQFSCLLHSS